MRLVSEQPVQSVQSRIAFKVAEIFESTGETQDGFAEMVSVSKRAVAYWLAGERIPTVANLVEMARVYGKDVSWFFEIEDQQARDLSAEEAVKAIRAHLDLLEARIADLRDAERELARIRSSLSE